MIKLVHVFLSIPLLASGSFGLQSATNTWGLETTQSRVAAEIYTPKQEVVVAVIDTGIDTTHPELKENLWTNPGESGLDSNGNSKATNLIDDDLNGFVDDVHGYSFADNSAHLDDNHGHGTHVSAIIKSVNPSVKIMSIKYCDPAKNPNANLANSIKAIRYAVKMGANIINYSGGGFGSSSEERQALELALNHRILVVAAAGNENADTDIAKYFPAGYALENILSVTAIDPSLKVLSSSNFGPKSVLIAAPGQDIYSALPNGKFGTMTGTSQATAFVSGAASMVQAESNLSLSPHEIIRQIVQTSDFNPYLKGKTLASSSLNTLRALQMKDQGINVLETKNSNLGIADESYFLLNEN